MSIQDLHTNVYGIFIHNCPQIGNNQDVKFINTQYFKEYIDNSTYIQWNVIP